jgi:hypothetical protein
VQFGAIVFAPLGVGCEAGGLGACQTASARLLSAETSNMMLELTPGINVPRLVPLTDRALIIPNLDKGAATSQQGTAVSSAEALTGKSTSGSVGQASLVSALLGSQSYQIMVWGVWSGGVPGDDLHTPYPFAQTGREAVVGSNSGTILYRDSQGSSQIPSAGHVEFSLRSAEVSMNQGGVSVTGAVQSGTLGVDFSQATYTTQLSLSHPSLPTVASLAANGNIRSDGLLVYSSSPTGTVVGTLSRNTLEAGYQFRLPTASGDLIGTTLWSR